MIWSFDASLNHSNIDQDRGCSILPLIVVRNVFQLIMYDMSA